MDTGFFRSRHFAISAVIAALILVAGATAVSMHDFGFPGSSSSECRVRLPTGDALRTTPRTTDEGATRILRWSADAAAFDVARIDVCLAVGDLAVEPADDGNVTLELRLRGGAPELRETFPYNVAFARGSDGGLAIAAWQGAVRERWSMENEGLPAATVVLRLPQDVRVEGSVASAFGHVGAAAVRAANLTLDTNSGDVRAAGLLLEGGLRAETNFGNVELELASVGTGRIVAESNSGDIDLKLPQRADVGYDVVAESSTGDIVVRIGDAESYENDSHAVGGTARVRSAGYGTKPTQVEIDADTSFGDVRVIAEN